MHTTTKKIRPILEITTPERIAIADKPPALGGKVHYISKTDFEKKFNFTFREGIFAPENFYTPELQAEMHQHLQEEKIQRTMDKTGLEALEEKLADRLTHPLEKVCVCHMGEDVGWGVFALDTIEAGEIICVYSGVIGHVTASGDYANAWVRNRQYKVDAKELGGIARFMQHLPMDWDRQLQLYVEAAYKSLSQEILHRPGIDTKIRQHMQQVLAPFRACDGELDNLCFTNASVRETLATVNLKLYHLSYQGVPVDVMVAERTIEKGQLMGWPYGLAYWQQLGKAPRYFTQLGGLIDPANYHYKDQPAAVSPQVQYGQAIELYKAQNYLEALNRLQSLLSAFQADPIKYATCLSTLASCARELNKGREALQYCVSAYKIYQEHDLNDKCNAIVEKIQSVIDKEKWAPEKVHQLAVTQFKENEPSLALALATISLAKFQALADVKGQAYCQSLRASCFRELKDMTAAASACKTAYDTALVVFGCDDRRTQKIALKLKGLEQVVPREEDEPAAFPS